jgi:endonuclease G
LIVTDNTNGQEALLTNWHILADNSFVREGDPITQPAAMDGGTAADAIATLTRWIIDEDGDAAIATLNRQRQANPAIRLIDRAPLRLRDPEPNEILIKCGRSTAVTRGRVSGRKGTYFPVYKTRGRVAIEGFEIVPEKPGVEISSPGDSGAVWVSEDMQDIVGLHFAGERDPHTDMELKEVAMACYATRVFARLSITPKELRTAVAAQAGTSFTA